MLTPAWPPCGSRRTPGLNVLSISRLYLRSLGFTNEQINALTDDDMQRIAEKLNNDYFIGFEEEVKFVVAHEIAEEPGGTDVKE